jgi:glycerophosphoryl diester phosphodiesterase
VNVWTVNKPEDIQRMIDLKVDYITTDVPLLVEEMLDKMP